MSIKKLHVLYFSATGTSRKIVRAIASGLGEVDRELDLTLLKDRLQSHRFTEQDVVVVGVPVYAGRVPVLLSNYFQQLQGQGTPVVLVVVYGNRDYDDALLELKDLFETNGFRGIAAGAFVGEHSYSSKVATARPDADDLETARVFGKKVRQKLAANEDGRLLEVKGNYPYKELVAMPPMAPETNALCTNCGLCAEHCPTEAIDFNDCRQVDASSCIRCCSCVKRCPLDAKSFQHERIVGITHYLVDHFSAIRKAPETFL